MAEVNLELNEKYPGNSNRRKFKEEKEESKVKEKNITKVIDSKAVKKKKSLGKKITEAFISDESDSVSIFDYLLYEVLVPAAKDTISDAVTSGIEMLLFGERKRSRRSNNNRSYINYSNYSRREDRNEYNSRSRRAITKVCNDDILLETRSEAEEVIDRLLDIIDEYDSASVADLYELVGIDSEYTDNKYGWTNLSSASVSRTRDGYLLNLPKAKPLFNW